MRTAIFAMVVLLMAEFHSWTEQAENWYLSRLDPLTKFSPGDAWTGHKEDEIRLWAAANEYESAQLMVCAGDFGVCDATVEVTDLIDPEHGGCIPASSVTWRIVGYVHQISKYPWGPSGIIPDPLYHAKPFQVAPQQQQPIWLTVYVPPGTAKGQYEGWVKVVSANCPAQEIKLAVSVWNFEIPKKQSLQTIFALRPKELQEWISGRMTEDSWEQVVGYDMLERYIEFLLKYRITPQLYDEGGSHEHGNVAWYTMTAGAKAWWAADGSLQCDWRIMDRYYEKIVAGGGSTLQAAYLGGLLCHPDDPQNPDVGPNGLRAKFYRAYLPQLYAHLQEKGWVDKAFFYAHDEPPAELIEGVRDQLRFVRRYCPDIRRMVVVQDKVHLYPPTLERYADMWVIPWSWYEVPKAQVAQKAGKETWTYLSVCGVNAPNLFIGEPWVRTRIVPWLAHRYQMDGVLNWGTIFWGEWGNYNTMRGRQRDMNPDGTLKPTWGSNQRGNGYSVYPGGHKITDPPQPSIRLETLRDGMEDYEYLVILERLVERARAKKSTSAARCVGEYLLSPAVGLLNDATEIEGQMPGAPEKQPLYLQLLGDDQAIWGSAPWGILQRRLQVGKTIELLQEELGDV